MGRYHRSTEGRGRKREKKVGCWSNNKTMTNPRRRRVIGSREMEIAGSRSSGMEISTHRWSIRICNNTPRLWPNTNDPAKLVCVYVNTSCPNGAVELSYGYGHERHPDRTLHKVSIAQKRIASHPILLSSLNLQRCIPAHHIITDAACVRSPIRPFHAPTVSSNAKCAHVPDTPNADSNSAPSTVQSDLQISIISLISYSTGSNASTPYNNLDGLRPGNHKVPSHPNDH